jgi:hypothetical protein
MADSRNVNVRVEGLREFRRDLRKLSPEVNRELTRELKTVAEPIAAEARALAPKRTGRYAASIRVYAAGAKVSIGSRLPQAGVLHWGGTIRPRGVPITFKRRPVIMEAADQQSERIVDGVGDAVERAARKAGWHTI